MTKTLLVSGSPRKGNSEFILQKISQGLKSENELVLLRDEKINYCLGCSACFDSHSCVQNDAMKELIARLKSADLIILGTPNYYDNVSALLKNFFDRTSPLYDTGLAGKKMVAIISAYHESGSESVINCEKIIRNYARLQNIDVIGIFPFQAEGADDVRNNPESVKRIEETIADINKLSDAK